MKRILFVDHAFHRRTQSAVFFTDILRTAFDVEFLYLEPEPIQNLDILRGSSGIDAILIWQLDHLAPVFLSQGFPTIVVPMFDGSNGLPDLHWIASKDARFINFSLFMHTRLRGLKCDTLLVKYYPPPARQPSAFSSLQGFLWQRRPRDGFNIRLVERLFGTSLDALHLHHAPDELTDSKSSWQSNMFPVQRSRWFKDRSAYLQILSDANVFIAPREAEGIGHSFLEAMARGMVVVANDRPTHSEYISHGVNGLLFDVRAPKKLVYDNAFRIGRSAWETVAEGHLQWLAAIPTMLQFIKECPRPKGPYHPSAWDQFPALIEAFYAGGDRYEAALQNLYQTKRYVR